MDGKQLEIGNSKFMNQQGYFYQRVADIGTAVHVAVDGEYAGYILITDVIRKEAGRLLKWLKKQQIEAVMITGDNERGGRRCGPAVKAGLCICRPDAGGKGRAGQRIYGKPYGG